MLKAFSMNWIRIENGCRDQKKCCVELFFFHSGCLSMQTIGRHSVKFCTGDFFDLQEKESFFLVFCSFFCATIQQWIYLLFANKLVARFSMPTLHNYSVGETSRREKYPKKGRYSLSADLTRNQQHTHTPKERKNFNVRWMRALEINIIDCDAPCWVWNSLWEYCNRTHFWLYTPTLQNIFIRVQCIPLASLSAFAYFFSACPAHLFFIWTDFGTDFEFVWFFFSLIDTLNLCFLNNIYSLHLPQSIDAYLFSTFIPPICLTLSFAIFI